MKRVRKLLRVSSEQQLEKDGDLAIQRKIVEEYIMSNPDWVMDEKEYFEGSNSGYKNKAIDRAVLREILNDAKADEFDILAVYKDDRLGRLMFDTSLFVMELKRYDVDVYTVKEGLITPDTEDILGQMMLTFRFANAQKSSADTGMRVRDTAQKMVEQGKFMGGSAPYGFRLEYSGEISKHGRALKKLVVFQEEAEVVRYIFKLSLEKEFGASKIAKELNLDDYYKEKAPKDVWKSGTITSILTNPIYTGRVAYKRREHVGGKYHRLDSSEWIIARERNDEIAIIDDNIWIRVQEKRRMRSSKYRREINDDDVTVIKRNDGQLPLVDVLYCGECGCKMTNGSRYNYWTIKSTGEKRVSIYPVYKCQAGWSGVPHEGTYAFRADEIEPVVFEALAEYIEKLRSNEDVMRQIESNHDKEKLRQEKIIRRKQGELESVKGNISAMESKVPLAIQGNYALSLEELMEYIRKEKDKQQQVEIEIEMAKKTLESTMITRNEWEEVKNEILTWREVFLNADTQSKRVLINKLINRIEITNKNIVVKFKIDLREFVS